MLKTVVCGIIVVSNERKGEGIDGRYSIKKILNFGQSLKLK